ncbi:tail fiber domain-containing protein [uncultured Mucilaginibacter sp.]|uniref:tail fiber domain-containing protein n=1 Tax=uncultured Mucilaginibacter sp. TaxID=797541 RepID=UPI00342A891B
MLNYVGTSFDNNTSVGYFNMVGLTTGNANTSVGGETMLSVGTGSSNTAIGNHALLNVTNSQNTALGASAGSTVTSGANNTLLGFNADVASATLNNATAIGSGASVAASNTMQLGNTTITNVKTSGTLTAGAVTYPNTDGTSGYVLTTNGSGTPTWQAAAAGASATGSTNYMAKFTGASALGNSLIYDDGTNVGIGTSSPSARFQIGTDGSGSAENYKWGVVNGFNTLQLGYRQTGWKFKTDNSSGVVNNLIFSKTNGTTDVDCLTLSGGGDITAANNLNVTGNITAANGIFTNLNVDNGSLSYSNSNGFFGIKTNGAPTSLFQVSTNSGGNFSLKYDDGAGTLGGGTLALAFRNNAWKLNVQQNSGVLSDLVYYYNNGTSDLEYMRLNTSGYLGLGTSSISHLLTLNGGAYCDGTTWVNASDARLKRDILPLHKYGLAQVMQLKPVTYFYKSDKTNHPEVGFIAQDVQKIIPEVVSGKEGDLSKGETLGLSYGNLVPVLTKAIQEQQKQIEAQQKQIDELKALVDKLIKAKQ